MVKKLAKYFTIGILNGFIFYCIMAFFIEVVHIWYMWAAILTLCITVTGTFASNFLWTWRHKKKGIKSVITIYRFLKFVIVGCATAILGLTSLYLTVNYLYVSYTITYIVMSFVLLIINFTLHNNWTWGDSESKELVWIVKVLDKTKVLVLIKKLGVEV